jgi:glucose-1-phosphate cytidylyltransferase
MKVVILAGGLGTRLAEETGVRPKPMVEIGDRPILWHIMKGYSTYGLNDFIICLGYKGRVIMEYFSDYALHNSDVTFDLANSTISFHRQEREPWRVTLVDTGKETMTGGRVKRVRQYIGEDTFCMTYGDGVSNVDVTALIKFHLSHGKLATVTAVQPPGRFGTFALSGDDPTIRSFTEKKKGDGAWINGGFFVLEPRALDYIEGDATVWEHKPMSRLARDGQLMAYRHTGFWHPMDSLQDKAVLVRLWDSGRAPWNVWRHSAPQ